MKTVLIQELKRTRKSMLIWGLIVGFTAALGMLEYPALAPYLDMLEQVISAIPYIWQLLFGMYGVDLQNPIGYFLVMYYWAGLIVFAHAIYIGVSIIAKESRDRTAEYLFTMPVKRSSIIWAKILAGGINLFAVGFSATAMSMLSMLPITRSPEVYRQIVWSGIGMLLTQCLLMALGLLCAALLKTYHQAALCAAAVLLASYGLMFFVQYREQPTLNFLSPLSFFGAAEVTANGLNAWYLLLCLLLIALCVYFVQLRYRRKTVIS